MIPFAQSLPSAAEAVDPRGIAAGLHRPRSAARPLLRDGPLAENLRAVARKPSAGAGSGLLRRAESRSGRHAALLVDRRRRLRRPDARPHRRRRAPSARRGWAASSSASAFCARASWDIRLSFWSGTRPITSVSAFPAPAPRRSICRGRSIRRASSRWNCSPARWPAPADWSRATGALAGARIRIDAVWRPDLLQTVISAGKMARNEKRGQSA